jgi:pimeloyl-ACP methyl ester carboxylesterase
MPALTIPLWVRRAAVAGVGALVILLIGATWQGSSVLGTELLKPLDEEIAPDLEVIAIGEGRIVLSRTDMSQQDGVWGVVGENGYGQASAVVEVRESEVERSFRPLVGDLDVGDPVRFDQYAYAGDPETAHGMSFEEVLVPGELGLYPAWFMDGDRDTWIIVVHGKGLDERKQALRVIPTFEQDRYPMLVISYRNDRAAPMSRTGLYGWGLEEWRDVEAALEFGRNKGAEDFVIMGFGMGGTIASQFLHESDRISEVRGVILDSPVLDLESVADGMAAGRSVPGWLAGWSKGLARIRFGVEWDELDQVKRADEFDIPILLMHGSEDDVVPVAVSDAFAQARSDIVVYERFDGAGHALLWNTNPQRYERTLIAFVEGLAADADA